jgi:hypothetical protein
MEHRWGRRQSTDLKVSFVWRSKIGSGRLSNVSVTGAFLETKAHLRLLSVLTLSITPRSRSASGDCVTAFVVRRDSAGVGLEWCEVQKTRAEARFARLTDGVIDAGTEQASAAREGTSTGAGLRQTAR